MIVKKLHYFKVICLVLISSVSFCLISEETTDSLEDEVLEVRDQFPHYRVLYNHQKVIQEVQEQIKSEESGKEQSEKSK